jgi:inner membrane protein
VDNLTHTLIGLLAGEVVARNIRTPAAGLPDATRRTTLLTLGMVGGNLPDVDLLWSMRFATDDQLTYLVQHRGYTHTLVGCAILTVMLVLGTLAVLRWRGHRDRAPDRWLFAAMSLFAVMLHLGMDAMNEYGIHPFWPWNNRWYYGDAVFIVEPLCWLALAPIYFSLQKRGARLFLGTALAVGCIAVLVFHRFGAVWWSLPVCTLLLVAGGRRLAPRAASWVAAGLLMAVLGLFSITHFVVLQKVQRLVAVQFPAATTLDIVFSPAPAHPFCWDVILLQRAGDRYVARLGQTTLLAQSPAPGMPFMGCSRSAGGPGTAPLVIPKVPVRSGMLWTGEYSINAVELARLAASNCDTQRLASFLRAPFAAPTASGWIIGDLRYDREPGVGFAELSIEPRSRPRCLSSSPWTAPRADLGLRAFE